MTPAIRKANASQHDAANGEPSKRKRGRNEKRVGIACNACRSSKLKCDGRKPVCDRCSVRRQSCIWPALDGRSVAAKKMRPAPSLSSRSSSSIDQLELLANAAVEGGPSPSPSYPFVQAGSTPSHFASSMPSFPSSPYSALPPSGSNTTVGRVGTPLATDQHMWWERGGPSVRRGAHTPTSLGSNSYTTASDALAMTDMDWSSLGLEPQQLTGEMIDLLTGKVVWVDHSPLINNVDDHMPTSVGPSTFAGPSFSSNQQQPATKLHAPEAQHAYRPVHPKPHPPPIEHPHPQQPRQILPHDRLQVDTSRKDPERVRIQYFRLMGPTGISPGIKKITMELKLTPSVRRALFDSTSPSSVRKQGAQVVDWERLISRGTADEGATTTAKATSASAVDDVGVSSSEDDEGAADTSYPDLFEGDHPAPWAVRELLPVFFDRLGDHYLCLKRAGIEARLGLNSPPSEVSRPSSVPPMLINVMCALAARYSPHPAIVAGRSQQRAHSFGKRFARKAKDFLATCLAVPSRSTVLAFLMMAWHEFACNLDSAFWNYGGLALRMAIDLGLQRRPATSTDSRDVSENDMIDDTLLFWAVYQMDRILAVGTGRPTSIKDREITTPLPMAVDVPTNDNIIFAHYIRHVRIGGQIAETINAVLLPDESSRHEVQRDLDSLEAELIRSYESIPHRLRLNPANFKATNQKHLFLEFHLWFHNLLFILNRSPIVEMRKSVSPFDAGRLVRKSVQRCADVVALDDTYDNRILESVPMANQTLFLAGCAELEEMEQRDVGQQGNRAQSFAKLGPSTSGHHLMREAEDGYRKFANALERLSIFWDGVRWIHGVLTQRRLGHSHKDLVELAVGTDALVSKRELHLLKRLSAVNDQSQIAVQDRLPRNQPSPSTQIPHYAVSRQCSRPKGMTTSNAVVPTSTPSGVSSLPVEISDIGSLDDLASLLPQLQNAIAAQSHQRST